MRDPVERFLSQQRMQLRKRGLLTPAHEIEHLNKASLKLLKRESPRNDYPATLDLRSGLLNRNRLVRNPVHRSAHWDFSRHPGADPRFEATG